MTIIFMGMNPTIKDIARKLNLSTSTVSRALTDHPDIKKETKNLVLKLARELDYQPNPIALSLKQNRTRILGVIIPETSISFFSKAISGIQEIAAGAGYQVMICSSHESVDIEQQNVQTLLNSRVDGLIVSVSKETRDVSHLARVLDKRVPTVFFDRVCDSLHASKVVADNFTIAFKTTEHLITTGRKRIAFVAGPQNLYNSQKRLEGYHEALKKYGLPADERLIIYSNYEGESVKTHTKSLLNLTPPVYAIFAIHDRSAIEMIHLIKQMRLKVPDDIAIVGFNNESFAAFFDPPLSSVDHPAFEMGKAAAELLLQHIDDANLPVQKRIIKSDLIIRQSSFSNDSDQQQ